jgi:hypothetical protein
MKRTIRDAFDRWKDALIDQDKSADDLELLLKVLEATRVSFRRWNGLRPRVS